MSDSLGHLIGRAGLVEWRVRALIAERRAVDVAPDDAFRGLYLSDEVVDQLLDGVADAPVPVETLPFARSFVAARIAALGGRPVLRMNPELNARGYTHAEYAGAGCIGCLNCFYACPEPNAIEVHIPVKAPAKQG